MTPHFRSARSRFRRALLTGAAGAFLTGAAGVLLAAGFAGTAAAAEDGGTAPLRFCASTKAAPYTMTDGSGFENRIAETVARAMGREAEFVWTDKPAIFLVRDMLDKQACDVIVGVDDGDPRVLTTTPYYRTGYVFISRPDGPEISNWSDDDISTLHRVAYQFHSPSEVMLKQTGLYEDNLIYQYSLVNFTDRRNQYTQVSGKKLVSEVVQGEADVAVAFAPDVARYVKDASAPLRMTVIDQNGLTKSGEVVPQQFDQSMAVRKDDTALRDALNAALAQAGPEVLAILRDEGIPVLDPSS